MPDPQLRIASQLLSALMVHDRHRTVEERAEDIQHSLDVAAELIRLRHRGAPPTCDHDPPRRFETADPSEPPATTTTAGRAPARSATKEQVVVREQPPLPQLLAERRARQADATPGPKRKGPTLH